MNVDYINLLIGTLEKGLIKGKDGGAPSFYWSPFCDDQFLSSNTTE